jgi:hypothetical protein
VNHAAIRAFLDGMDAETVREVSGREWNITHTSAGWLALRRGGGVLSWDGPDSLLRPVLFADRLGDLAEQLCAQTFLDQLSHEDMRRVYAAGAIPDDLFASPEGSET